jgi:hypothetical protein
MLIFSNYNKSAHFVNYDCQSQQTEQELLHRKISKQFYRFFLFEFSYRFYRSSQILIGSFSVIRPNFRLVGNAG